MCPQDSPRRRDIIQSIQKLDTEIASFNQQKQQLLHELKSIHISERSAAPGQAERYNASYGSAPPGRGAFKDVSLITGFTPVLETKEQRGSFSPLPTGCRYHS